MKLWVVVIQAFLQLAMIPSLHGGTCGNKTSNIKWIERAKTNKLPLLHREWWSANCQLANVNTNATLWKRKGKKEDTKVDKKMIMDGIKLKRDKNVFNLTNIIPGDAGSYYCYVCGEIKRVGGFFVSTEAKAFEYPKFINKPNSPIEYGATITLRCKTSTWYRFSWSKDDGSTGPYNYCSYDVENYRICEWTINKFRKQNEGVYICNAERSLVGWSAQDKIRLEVPAFVKPAFLNIPNNRLSLKEGDSLLLSFPVTGYPNPIANCWEEGKRQRSSIARNDSSIVIRISTLMYSTDNDISFQCNASNVNGSVTHKFSLNIWARPKIYNKESTRNKTIFVKTKTIDLSCKVDEANPSPSVQWAFSENNHEWSVVTPKTKFASIVGNKLRIKGQKSYKMFYKCIAKNSVGEDVFTWKVIDETAGIAYPSGDHSSSYVTVIIVISSLVVVLMLFFVIILYKRKRELGGFYIFTRPPYRDYIQILDQSKFIHEQTHKLPYMSEWEFPRENIHLQEELGSGAFGVVYLAETVGMGSFVTRRSMMKKKTPQRRFSLARLKKRNVLLSNGDYDIFKTAVKTLKVNYKQNDLSDILSELKVLIHVGEHENVLRILGACTKPRYDEAPLIVLEYCPHGNLREFLKGKRDIYEPDWKEVDNVGLSITDVATFALQIARGMEFLISRKCIHRDLAARNVLISDQYVAKISDFGLARDVYDNLEYVKVTPGVLPVKWMAIEAIRDRIFNEKTDVWSYGIVLWEMFTLGGTPYPDIDHSVVLSTLLNGKRMCPPIFCPQEISDIMQACWHKDSFNRPSFSDIVCQMQKLEEFPQTETEAPYQNVPA